MVRFSTLKVSASLFSVSVLILSRFSLISVSTLLRVTDKVLIFLYSSFVLLTESRNIDNFSLSCFKTYFPFEVKVFLNSYLFQLLWLWNEFTFPLFIILAYCCEIGISPPQTVGIWLQLFIVPLFNKLVLTLSKLQSIVSVKDQ